MKTSAQQLFDDICMDNLCRIFNKANLWRDLATLYDYTPYVDIWESNKNPSKLLFDYLEVRIEFEILSLFIQLTDELCLLFL